jgi:ATPases with chaperone activity, ATP-binding subunit
MEDLYQIIDLQVERLNNRLSEQDIRVELDDDAKGKILSEAYVPEYGARPLKRYISRHLETQLSERMLKDELRPHQRVFISTDGLTFTFDIQAHS